MEAKTKREFLVINEKGQHEFDILVITESSRNTYKLFSSDNSLWAESFRKQLLLTMEDTGDGFKFNRSLDNIGYDVAQNLHILLSFDMKVFTLDKSNFKIIEKDAIVQLW